jgi:hypothetical protein
MKKSGARLPLMSADEWVEASVGALEARRAAEAAEAEVVRQGRRLGYPWDYLGVCLGVNRETLRRRYGARS